MTHVAEKLGHDVIFLMIKFKFMFRLLYIITANFCHMTRYRDFQNGGNNFFPDLHPRKQSSYGV